MVINQWNITLFILQIIWMQGAHHDFISGKQDVSDSTWRWQRSALAQRRGNLCATSSTFAGRRHMIGKVVTGCVAILPYHTATQDRGSECRDFGFISRIVTALVLGISRYPEPRYQNRYREWKNVIGTSLFVIHDEVVIVNQYFLCQIYSF